MSISHWLDSDHLNLIRKITKPAHHCFWPTLHSAERAPSLYAEIPNLGDNAIAWRLPGDLAFKVHTLHCTYSPALVKALRDTGSRISTAVLICPVSASAPQMFPTASLRSIQKRRSPSKRSPSRIENSGSKSRRAFTHRLLGSEWSAHLDIELGTIRLADTQRKGVTISGQFT